VHDSDILADQLGQANTTRSLTTRERHRLDRVGLVAYRHWRFIHEHGSMTLGDSLKIRRELYGANVRSTANPFGRRGEGEILHRATSCCTRGETRRK